MYWSGNNGFGRAAAAAATALRKIEICYLFMFEPSRSRSHPYSCSLCTQIVVSIQMMLVPLEKNENERKYAWVKRYEFLWHGFGCFFFRWSSSSTIFSFLSFLFSTNFPVGFFPLFFLLLLLLHFLFLSFCYICFGIVRIRKEHTELAHGYLLFMWFFFFLIFLFFDLRMIAFCIVYYCVDCESAMHMVFSASVHHHQHHNHNRWPQFRDMYTCVYVYKYEYSTEWVHTHTQIPFRGIGTKSIFNALQCSWHTRKQNGKLWCLLLF